MCIGDSLSVHFRQQLVAGVRCYQHCVDLIQPDAAPRFGFKVFCRQIGNLIHQIHNLFRLFVADSVPPLLHDALYSGCASAFPNRVHHRFQYPVPRNERVSFVRVFQLVHHFAELIDDVVLRCADFFFGNMLFTPEAVRELEEKLSVHVRAFRDGADLITKLFEVEHE